LVFVPGIGMKAGGANSWIDLGFTTFQPSELLKFTFVIFFASFLTVAKEKITDFKYGFLPSLGLIGIPAIVLLAQPDMGTLFSIVCASLAMFLVAGGKKRHFLIFILLGITMVFAMAYLKPHVLARLKTFMDPMKDQQGSGYQIKQSLIAVGSGGLTGRGFGQSIQKFTFLPEAIGDSVFSVAAEEFGFIGSTIIILLYLFFGLRGFKIAGKAPDSYGRLVVVGITTLVIA
jgi:cell division protein FtsW